MFVYEPEQLCTFAILCHASLLFVLFLQVNFSEESLRENIGAFVNALLLAKPVGLKKSKWSAGRAYMLIYTSSFVEHCIMSEYFSHITNL
jgi:hypothetical protein